MRARIPMTKTLATSAFLTAALLLGAASPALAKPDKATLELVMPVLVRGSKSGDFETRAAAVEALGYGPKKDVEKAITESLTDPQWNVRRGAIRALDHMKDKRAWEKAVGAAMRDPKVDADEVMRLIEPLGAKKGVALVMANLRAKSSSSCTKASCGCRTAPWKRPNTRTSSTCP